jgi:hypothetical protein
MEQEYIPYGPEWQIEMARLPKATLIGMLRKAHLQRKEAVEVLKNYTQVMERFLETMPDEFVIDLIAAAVVQDAHKQAKNLLVGQ